MRLAHVASIAVASALACGAGAAHGQTVAYRQLYAFQTNLAGALPGFLSFIGKTLYGATQYGGSKGDGTVFSLDPATGVENTVYAFRGGSDGANPSSSLTKLGALLYGTTNGTVYSLNSATGAETVVYRFQGGSDGSYPGGKLIPIGHLLYGTTTYGGSANGYGYGTVYSLDTDTGVEKVVFAFNGSDGSAPNSLLNVGGTLYGVTALGGASDNGVLFSLDAATGSETVLYSFKGGADGEYPDGLVDIDGIFYGTTYYGGSPNCTYSYCEFGTVFSFQPATRTETILYDFKGGNDGGNPGAALAIGNSLYGETSYGGSTLNCVNSLAAGCGVVFSFNLATNTEQALYSFQGGADGSEPSSLIRAGTLLYGATAAGGGSNACSLYYDTVGCGTVFQMSR